MTYGDGRDLRNMSYFTLAFLVGAVLFLTLWFVDPLWGIPENFVGIVYFAPQAYLAVPFVFLTIFFEFATVSKALWLNQRADKPWWTSLFVILLLLFILLIYFYFFAQKLNASKITAFDLFVVGLSAFDLVMIPICALVSSSTPNR